VGGELVTVLGWEQAARSDRGRAFPPPLVKDLIVLGTAIWTAGESIDAAAATRGSR
jgi:hypothetical protein